MSITPKVWWDALSGLAPNFPDKWRPVMEMVFYLGMKGAVVNMQRREDDFSDETFSSYLAEIEKAIDGIEEKVVKQ